MPNTRSIGSSISPSTGRDNNRHERARVQIEHRQWQPFLGFEEVVEASGIGLGALEDFRDPSGGVAAQPEEIECGINYAVTRSLPGSITQLMNRRPLCQAEKPVGNGPAIDSRAT